MTFARGDTVYVEFDVSDMNAGDMLTVTGSPPAGINIIQIGPTTWALSGTLAAGLDGSYSFDLTVTDDGSPPLSASTTATIIVGPYALSPLAGKLVVTEVLYHQSDTSTQYDEFIEVRNIGGSAVNLAGLRIVDANLIEDGPDPEPLAASNLDATLGSVDMDDKTSSLQPGRRAVLWVRDPAQFGENHLTPAQLHYDLQRSFLPLPALDNAGDDVWILDANGRLVAYVAWGNSGQGQLGTPPRQQLGIWEPRNQGPLNDLNNLRVGESIALATDGANAFDSACWEENGRGTATASGCTVPVGVTRDKDFSPSVRDSSAGKSNL